MLSLDRQNTYRTRYQSLRQGWLPATQVYEQVIRSQLKPDLIVLDIGCGRGGVLEQLEPALSHPIGLDPDLISLIEHRLPALPRAQALADALPLRAASVDVIVCSWVFEHLADVERTFAEMARILRPGGQAIFLTPHTRSLVVILNRVLKPLQHSLVRRLYGRAEADTFPVLYRANTISALCRLAEGAGLELDTVRLVEDPSYLAFSPLLFRLSIWLSRWTPPVHLVGSLRKPL